MNHIILYAIGIVLCSGLFLALYRLLIQRKAGYTFCRRYLVVTLILAAVIPAFDVPVYVEKAAPAEAAQPAPVPAPTVRSSQISQIPQTSQIIRPSQAVQEIVQSAPVSDPNVVAPSFRMNWNAFAVAVYLVGLLVSLALMLRSYIIIARLKKGSRLSREDGYELAQNDDVESPFSFGKTIFMGRVSSDSERRQILSHEMSHIGHHHTQEKLLMSAIRSCLWFNPFAWLQERHLEEVQEWQADADVLAHGFNVDDYRNTILKTLLGVNPAATSGLNSSFTKKRMQQMGTEENHGHAAMVSLAAIALTAVCFCLFSLKVQARPAEDGKLMTGSPAPAVQKRRFPYTKPVIFTTSGFDAGDYVPDNIVCGYVITDPYNNPLCGMFLVNENGRYTIMFKKAGRTETIDVESDLAEKLASSLNGNIANAAVPDEAVFYEGNLGYAIVPGKSASCWTDILDEIPDEIWWNESLRFEISKLESKPEMPYVEIVPEFPGGDLALLNYLKANLKYPKEAIDKGLQGRVLVRFTVETDGSITGSEVVKPVHALLDKEALRLIDGMPGWIPGKNSDGELVRMEYTVPVNFRLDQVPQVLDSAATGPAGLKAGDMITGTVSNSGGPLMIVNVLERDNMDRVVASEVTDDNGRFSFTLVNPDDYIEFSYIGYKTVKQKIDRPRFNVTMNVDTNAVETLKITDSLLVVPDRVDLFGMLSQTSDSLDSLMEQMQKSMREPITDSPEAGGTVNGHVLDIDGNPIRNRTINVCERDLVGRAVTMGSASGDDGFFSLFNIRSPENHLAIEAEGYESQNLPLDRGTFEVRLKPAPVTLKPGDVVRGSVTCSQKTGPFTALHTAIGAKVEEVDRNGNVVASVLTDENGFSLTIVNPRDRLVISTDGYTPVSTSIEIRNYSFTLHKIQ